jgi:hypothetical protein
MVNDRYVLSSGVNVARYSGFDKPIEVILYYEGEINGRTTFTMLAENLFPPPNPAIKW